MFHEVSRNSQFIAVIFGEDMGDFNNPKITGLDQSFLCITAVPQFMSRCQCMCLKPVYTTDMNRKHLAETRREPIRGGSASASDHHGRWKCRFCICPWMDGSRAMQEQLPRSKNLPCGWRSQQGAPDPCLQVLFVGQQWPAERFISSFNSERRPCKERLMADPEIVWTESSLVFAPHC